MIQALDLAVLGWIQTYLKCGVLDFLMPKITLLAEYGIVFILTGIVLLLWKPRRASGAALLFALSCGLIIGNLLLKNLIARPRPCWLDSSVALLVPMPHDYSFPSGHALHSAIAATVLLYYDRRIGIPAAVVAVLVAFSRLYLYVHYPTDVIAGAVLGIAIGLLAVTICERIRRIQKNRYHGAAKENS